MQVLKADTAVTLKIGPFIDETDGKTAETGLTIAQADVRLSKNGGDIAQKTEATSCTHDELGVYGCPIDGTDTDTEGRLQLWVHEAGALPVFHDFMVVNANVYDSLYAAATTDYLQVDTIQVTGTSQTANDNGADINEILTDTGATLENRLIAIEADTDVIDDGTSGLVKIASDVAAALVDTGTTLDTLVKDIPTTAEFEARSDVAGTAATPAEVATALTTYDAPTKTEMDTGHGLLATEAKQDIIDTNVDQIETAVITNAAGTDIAADIIAIKASQLGVIHSTTIASVTDDKTFVLTASGLDGDTSADDDAWNNCSVTIEDATGTAVELRRVSDYGGEAKQIILDRVTKFNLAAGDIVKFYPSYAPTATGSVTEQNIADIADAVHDETAADHTTAGTMGYKLNNARGGRYEF